MARYPKAIWKPIRENATQGRIIPRAIILHSAVSDALSLYDFFQNSSELESHFYVRRDGQVEQYLDTTVRADANYKANPFAVSIETWDGRFPDVRSWTPEQMEGLTGLCDWLCRTHAIPRVSIPTWDGTGIGYHTQFGAPGPWTPVAKTCPGRPRINQMPALIRGIQLKEVLDMDALEFFNAKLGTDATNVFERYADKPGTVGHWFLNQQSDNDAARAYGKQAAEALTRIENLLRESR